MCINLTWSHRVLGTHLTVTLQLAAPCAILSFVEFVLLCFPYTSSTLLASAHYVIARIECYAKCKRHTDPAERPSHNGFFFSFFLLLLCSSVCVSVKLLLGAVHLGGSRHSCLIKHYVLNWCAVHFVQIAVKCENDRM